MGFPAYIFILALVLSCAVALKFDHHGKFKILQVADMHYVDGSQTGCRDVLPEQFSSCSDLNTTAFLKRMIMAERPDLIVFTGNNIYGPDVTDPASSLDAAFSPAVNSRVPWAAVLGNHDQESTMNRQDLMDHIVNMEGSVAQVNPPLQETDDIAGFGNYNLEILTKNNTALDLFFLDSGDYYKGAPFDGSAWIHESQQAWMNRKAARLEAKRNVTRPVPLLVFFHIPLPEFDILTDDRFLGVKQERVDHPKVNSGFFQRIARMGRVKAAFVGHDHVNDFCGELNGTYLCYGGGFGYHGYGRAGWARRARVIEVELAGNEVEEIRTWKRLDDEPLTLIDKEMLWSSTWTSRPSPSPNVGHQIPPPAPQLPSPPESGPHTPSVPHVDTPAPSPQPQVDTPAPSPQPQAAPSSAAPAQTAEVPSSSAAPAQAAEVPSSAHTPKVSAPSAPTAPALPPSGAGQVLPSVVLVFVAALALL